MSAPVTMRELRAALDRAIERELMLKALWGCNKRFDKWLLDTAAAHFAEYCATQLQAPLSEEAATKLLHDGLDPEVAFDFEVWRVRQKFADFLVRSDAWTPVTMQDLRAKLDRREEERARQSAVDRERAQQEFERTFPEKFGRYCAETFGVTITEADARRLRADGLDDKVAADFSRWCARAAFAGVFDRKAKQRSGA